MEQEKKLWRMADEEYAKLSAVGHELGEWQQAGDLKLENTCRRCGGSVSISVGKIFMIGYVPLLQPDLCLADYPEQMEAAQREWDRRLARVYAMLLGAAEKRKRREADSKADEHS